MLRFVSVDNYFRPPSLPHGCRVSRMVEVTMGQYQGSQGPFVRTGLSESLAKPLVCALSAAVDKEPAHSVGDQESAGPSPRELLDAVTAFSVTQCFILWDPLSYPTHPFVLRSLLLERAILLLLTSTSRTVTVTDCRTFTTSAGFST